MCRTIGWNVTNHWVATGPNCFCVDDRNDFAITCDTRETEGVRHCNPPASIENHDANRSGVSSDSANQRVRRIVDKLSSVKG